MFWKKKILFFSFLSFLLARKYYKYGLLVLIMELKEMKIKIRRILKKYGIVRAGIFGSYSRGKQGKNSDIDILIEFNGSLLKLVKIEREIKENLKIKVDLITYKGINPLLKEKILKEEIRII